MSKEDPVEKLLQDLRFGAKLLWKEKIFTLTVLATLAVCIGANTTIFSVVSAVLLDPLSYPEPNRLVRVFNSYPQAGAPRASTSAPDYFFRRERVNAFDEVASYQYWGHTVGDPGSTERVQTMRVTPSFFPMLGASPRLGRTFSEDETEYGNERKVVLTFGYWQERYAGDIDVIGRALRVNGNAYTIVGVLHDGFRFLGERDSRFFVPIPFSEEDRTVARVHNNNYEMIARLAPAATTEQAEAQIRTLDATLAPDVPIPNYQQLIEDIGYHVEVHDLRADLLRDVRPTLLMLWVGVGFVLLLGCLNIANLMLARTNVRATELATRMALGSDRSRLARQLLTESLLMAVLGGVLGLALGAGGLALLGGLGVDDLPRGAEVGIDLGVVLFTLATALLAGIVFGSIPLAHIFRDDLNSVFRFEGRSRTASRRAVLLRSSLVTGQVAIAFVLLIGAGLMFASLRAALRVDPGFRPDSVLTGFVSLPGTDYPESESLVQFIDDWMRETRALPGVTHASVTTQVPFGDNNSSSVILPEGYMPPAGESLLSPFNTTAGPDYFETMGISLVAGRFFDESDNADAGQVIILDQWLAERYFPNNDALGKRMLYGAAPGSEDDNEDNLYTIVGIVGNIKQNDLTEAEHIGAYYFTYKQRPPRFMTLVARTTTDPVSLTPSIRRLVSRIDPDLPFFAPETMEERVADSLVTRRSPMILLSVFAAVALFLSAIGIYGVLAYSVAQRTRELGIRMALGSSPSEVSRLVVLQGTRVIAIGLVIGLAGSLLLAQLIQSLLYGTEPTSPSVMVSVAALLTAVGFGACVLPARRATRIDPVVALNAE